MKLFVFLIGLVFLFGCASNTPKSTLSAQLDSAEANPAEADEIRGNHFTDQGINHYRRGDFPRAITALEASLLIDKETTEPWPKYLLFYSYLSTGRYQEALEISEELIKTAPYQSLGYVQVGLAKLWMGKPSEAVHLIQRAMEFSSHAPRSYFYLGLAHALNGNQTLRDKAFHSGEKEYQQILSKNPKDFLANYELASLYLYWNRNILKATELLAAAKESIPAGTDEEMPQDRKLFAQFYIPLQEGIFLIRKGDGKAAMKPLLESLTNAPSGVKADLAELYFYLGKAEILQRNKDSAKLFLEKSIDTDPTGPFANDGKGLLRNIASK